MAHLQAVIDPPVQAVALGSSAEFSCIVTDGAGHESAARPMSYEWEAAPYIVQEQRYTFSEDKHKLEIYNVQMSDNNTAVWCRVDGGGIGWGPSNRAKARIVVLPSGHGGTHMNTPSPSPISMTTGHSMISSTSERRDAPAAGATVACLLFLLVAFAVLLFFVYRKMRPSRRSNNMWIGSKLLGAKNAGGKKPPITRYTDSEAGYQEPVIPAINNPPQYTSLTTSTTPINKRPIPPPRNKRGRRHTEPAPLCSISEETEGYHNMRPNSAEPSNLGGTSAQAGYMDMSGKSGKKKNKSRTQLHRVYSPDDDTDYENIIVKTIGKHKGTHMYVNQGVADKSNKGHLPSHLSSNYSSNKPHGGSGTLVYASLDLGEVPDGQVFLPPDVEKTTYAKILRILSVFRTMRSTRIRVIHTGLDGKHAQGECATTRYR